MRNRISFFMIIILMFCITGCMETNRLLNKNVTNPAKIYTEFLSEQQVDDLNSITNAVNRFFELKSDIKSENDEMFSLFHTFYYKVIGSFENRLHKIGTDDEFKKLDASTWVNNGIVVINSEAGLNAFEEPSFLKTIFYYSVSKGVQEYLELNYDERISRETGFLIEDALLTISWDELSDYIIRFEKYLDEYSEFTYVANKVLQSKDFYIYLYTQCLDMDTFDYMRYDYGNPNEHSDSFIRFIETYPDSKYHPIILGYIDVLEKNGFVYDETAKKYLKECGIKID